MLLEVSLVKTAKKCKKDITGIGVIIIFSGKLQVLHLWLLPTICENKQFGCVRKVNINNCKQFSILTP